MTINNHKTNLRILFFGSGDFAARFATQFLIAGEYFFAGVVTQPDRPVGRKRKLTPPPLKRVLSESGLYGGRYYQPEQYAAEEEDILAQVKPDLIIVADYGQILPKKTINYPKYKCLNLHGSLLPELRGAVPVPLAILQGKQTTGVSIPIMTPGLDDGPVIAAQEVAISSRDTTASLKDKLADLAAELLLRVLPGWLSGELTAHPQDHALATYAPALAISKEKARLTPNIEVVQADRMIRAFYPWPIVWTNIVINEKIKRLKILKASSEFGKNMATNGEFYREGTNLMLQLPGGSLQLQELQLEGKQKAQGVDYLFLSEQKLKILSK